MTSSERLCEPGLSAEEVGGEREGVEVAHAHGLHGKFAFCLGTGRRRRRPGFYCRRRNQRPVGGGGAERGSPTATRHVVGAGGGARGAGPASQARRGLVLLATQGFKYTRVYSPKSRHAFKPHADMRVHTAAFPHA